MAASGHLEWCQTIVGRLIRIQFSPGSFRRKFTALDLDLLMAVIAVCLAPAVQRPFLIAQTARAVRMTSAAMGCTAGARQTAMTAISQMIGPPRGPFPESRISAPFRWAAPRLARQRRPAVAGRSLSTRANGRRSTGTMVSANMESAGWRRANFFPFSRRCATTSSGRWPRPVGCP